jgi:PAS domain-containing protein
MAPQKPLELILARNLLSSLSTPAFLVGELGMLVYFNDAAAAMLGKRFEETGRLQAQEWTHEFGPFDPDDEPIPYDQIPATIAGRSDQPYHGTFRICTAVGKRDVEASTIPVVGPGGSTGAIVFFWEPVDEDALRSRKEQPAEAK